MSEIFALLKAYEGLGPNKKGNRWYPYQCAADPIRRDGTKPWTCGFGHLMSKTEERDGVRIGSKHVNAMRDGLSDEECEILLAQDVNPRLMAVKKALPNASDRVLGSFLDCVFNAGEQCLHSSPGDAIRSGNIKYAAERLLLYRIAGGVPIRGLWRRRMSDSIFMLSGQVVLVKDGTVAGKPSNQERNAMGVLSNLLGKRIAMPPGLR